MASNTTLNSVIVNIKKAVRIISFKKSDEPSAPLFKELNILPLKNSYKLKQAKFMWKLINDYLPKSISNNFQKHSTSINVRSIYSLPAPRLDLSSRHISFAGLKLWNEIPTRIKHIKTFNSFSKSLQAHLLNNHT